MRTVAGVGVWPTAGVVVSVEGSRGQSTVFAGGQVLSSTPLAQRWEASGQTLGSLFSLLGTSFSISQSLSGSLPGTSSVSEGLSVSDLRTVCVCTRAHVCFSLVLPLSVCLGLSLSLSLSFSHWLCLSLPCPCSACLAAGPDERDHASPCCPHILLHGAEGGQEDLRAVSWPVGEGGGS